MFTLKSTKKLYNLAANHYTETSLKTGHYGFLIKALEDLKTPFGEAIVEYTKTNITKSDTLAQVVSNLYSLATLSGQLGDKYKEEFYQIANVVAELPVEDSAIRGSYLSPDAAREYFLSIESPVGRAVQCLAYTAGLSPNDLLRELNGLQYLKDGLANVGERYHAVNNAPRTVHFDPSLLNELDPEGEVVGVVADIVESTNAANAGIKGLALSSYSHGSGFTIQDLRNSHAINLLNEGLDSRDVAEIQGVKQGSLTERLRKFRRNAGLK